jgi:hypothetical protein
MGDLTPVIEGSVKFRDGKKVNRKGKSNGFKIRFFDATIFNFVLVETAICQRHPIVTGGR